MIIIISLLWAAFGYSLSFVGDGLWLGSFDRAFLAGLGTDSVHPAAKTIPEALFMLYQMTFAIITMALLAGSVADRMRFSAYLMFQLYGVAVTLVWSAGVTYGLLKLVSAFMPLRVSREHELEGLDITQHGEALQ
jgi:ammonia channel protein AmtB